MRERLNYWRRIFKVYLTKNKGYLNFWHERPAVSEGITPEKIGPYYMTFADKANYAGPRDKDGVILFDYFSNIGRQHNPVAIAQYGLGHYNLYFKTKDQKNLNEFLIHVDWLVKNLEANESGVPVWRHHFEWRYKKILAPGWYSALSQGSGISLLIRAYNETKKEIYRETAEKAFISMKTDMGQGGVLFTDNKGDIWLEEYMVTPPTHIINGFLWAFWGVWDYLLMTGEKDEKLLHACLRTLKNNLHRYDAGLWSLYDLSKQKMKMFASPFYHALHITQLNATHILTGDPIFKEYAEKFEKYQKNPVKKTIALIYKSIFKFLYF